MGIYIKKSIIELMNKIDNKSLPKKWDKFIENESKEHNFLIRNGNTYYCTCCKTTFEGKPKIGTIQKCPNCKQKLEVRSKKLTYYCFFKKLTMLDKENEQLVIRLFELKSTYCHTKKLVTHSVVEYGRIVVNENYTLLNDRISSYISSVKIYHYLNVTKWRKYTGILSFNSRGTLYPYNLKKILKNTRYEYSELWTFTKKIKGCDLENLLTGVAKSPSFELLVKMKLYKLALVADEFDIKGSFQERFGVGKEYYEFIKKHNLSYEELKILQMLKIKNIKAIHYLNEKIGIYTLKEINKYISIDNLLKYKVYELDGHLYLDYLRFASELGMNLKDKKVIFPENLNEEHDKLNHRLKIISDLKTKENIARRYKELLQNKYQNKMYIVFPAQSVEALKDESKQQNHCVQSYAKRYGNGNCDIYFMRYVKNKEKSLVTIEVKDNHIVQKRKKDNELPEENENEFLEMWERNILQKCRV